MYQDVTSTFESFYAGTSARLLRFAYGLTGDMTEAQDLAQEAYARAWPRWKRLRGYENPESWLRLVVSRLAVDRLRWLGVRRARPTREDTVAPPPDEEMMTLVAALKRLPMNQRKALVLHYFLDMPVAEIAAETGSNVNTVKTWLSRGRVNIAAELSDLPPGKGDLAEVRDKARRRRIRTVATSFTAFLATAAATAAALLFLPSPTPPVLRPDLILPYGAPRAALAMVDGERVLTVWQGNDGDAHLGAIDLATGEQPWAPVDLGKFDDTFAPLGVRGGVLMLIGINDSAEANDFTFMGVDVNSGAVRWRRPPQKQGSPLFDMQRIASPEQPDEAAIVLVLGEAEVSGVDWRTGQVVWTAPSTSEAKYATPYQNRFAQVDAAGVVRVREVATGQVVSERSGVPASESGFVRLWDGWLYVPVADGMMRMPVTGTEPPTRLATGVDLYPVRCGRQTCVEGRGYVEGYDRQTAKLVWRHETQDPTLAAGDFGAIFTIAGTGPKNEWGEAPDDHTMVLDPDGKDITPPSLGRRRASWIDSDHLLLQREVEKVVITGETVGRPPGNYELSVYSFTTHEEQSLGQQHLYGNCAGVPGKYVCAGKDGFVLFR